MINELTFKNTGLGLILVLAFGITFSTYGQTASNPSGKVTDKKLTKAIREADYARDIGESYLARGESQEALNYLNRSLNISIEAGYKYGEARALQFLGMTYSALNQLDESLIQLNRALKIYKELNSKFDAGSALNIIGVVRQRQRNLPESIKIFKEGLEILATDEGKKVEKELMKGILMSNIAEAYIKLENYAEALFYLEQALLISNKTGNIVFKGVIVIHIAMLKIKAQQWEAAAAYLNQSYLLLSNDIEGRIQVLAMQMIVWYNLKKPRLAAFYGKQSINLIQLLRSKNNGLSKELKQIQQTKYEPIYRLLCNILIRESRLEEAHQAINSFKDQQFFDFSDAQLKQPAPVALSAREYEYAGQFEDGNDHVGSIGSEIVAIKRRLGNRQPNRFESRQLLGLESRLKAAIEKYTNIFKQAELDFAKPLDEKDKVEEPHDLTEMKTALQELSAKTGQKTVAIYQLVGEDSFSALLITAKEIKAVSSPIKGIELNNKALELWRLLQSDRYDTTVLSKQIYDDVFKPLENELPKDTTTIMWSLDGNLRYVPMAALWDGNQFLAQRFHHVNFTRADTVRMTRNLNPNWTGIGFGTTKEQTVEILGDKIDFLALRGVGQELTSIFGKPDSTSRFLTGNVLKDEEFNRINFLESLKQKPPVVHIASHFAFRPGDDTRSFLLLGDGTAFTLSSLKEQENLFQGVDLLTLSACETAAQQADASGREIDGFAELAQRLGANSVMATLWSVADESTAIFMSNFYRLKKENPNLTKAEIISLTQREMLEGNIKPSQGWFDERSVKVKSKDDKIKAPIFEFDELKPLRHPFYWAPFILFGNWK